ncbi:MAG: acyloxyacyl hydrolase [Candidatus Methylacidiphilales bacterium]|nr:acyloxyacyl hydrolase [Candidatus Methylacidiphilales bacterium]
MKTHFYALALLLASGISSLQAGSDQLRIAPALNEPRFVEDRISVQAVTGALFSGTGIGPKIPTFNYAQTNLRLGWMLNTPNPEGGFFAGNWEALAELSASGVFDGFGSVVIGPTALVRYNFVQPNWKVVPYVQAGAGIVYTDAYEDDNQQAIGQAIEFTPQASVGFKFLVNEEWSVDLEGMFHHISNASIAERNHGVNALGGFIGATYNFDKLWN